MGFGAFKLPTDEYRFTGECLSVGSNQKVYIDPAVWCIHGEYEAFGKYIVTESNVTAHLAQIHPFTLGWIADLHVPLAWGVPAKEQINRLALCNPTLTVFGGDLVCGSGEYLGSDMEDSWFENVWSYTKDRLSNNVWIKGNHDIDPGCYSYYRWFERLWCLRLGAFKFIGFDGYNEESVLPGSCWPCLSLTDVIWLDRKLNEDASTKVILVHQPLEQWHIYSAWVFKETSHLRCVFSGHSHGLMRHVDPHKEVAGIPVYINGTCSHEVNVHVATIATFMKDGSERTVLMDEGIHVAESHDGVEITAPKARDWNQKPVQAPVPVRWVKRINGHDLTLIVFCPSEGTVHIRITEEADHAVEVVSEVPMYLIGKGMYSSEVLYDSWTCSCGMTWNSTYVEAERPFKLRFQGSGR